MIDIAFLIGLLHAKGILVRVDGIKGYAVNIEGLEDDGDSHPYWIVSIATESCPHII